VVSIGDRIDNLYLAYMYDKLLIFFVLLICIGCRTDPKTLDTQDHTIHVGLNKDPQRISPMFAGRSSQAREIYPYLFLQLAEYDPKTLQLSPILAKVIPEEEKITAGPFKGGVKYTFEIVEEAQWMDGTPITALDYIFTIKAVKHPMVSTPAWKSHLKDLVDVEVDTQNPKKFSVIFKLDYSLALETAASFEIYPAHVYDPDGTMSDVQLQDYIDSTTIAEKMDNPVFKDFAKQFNDVTFQQEVMEGSGPYRLNAWETDQYISLVRKDNWWGDNYPDRLFLQAVPKEIVFHFIRDETSAITQLKSGSIDILTVASGTAFKQLQREEQEHLKFSALQLSKFYYLALNNRSTILGDPQVRKAIAHLIDVDYFIKVFEEGYGQRTVGTILPFHKYYADQLQPLSLSTDKAKELLTSSGWKDSDGDGVLDKTILGIETDLKLRIHISGGELGQRLALILKENAKQIGADIEIIQKDYRTMLRENIYTGDYDMTPLALQIAIAEYDPYNRWHSDNAIIGKDNITGYANEVVDEAIELLQSEKDTNIRKDLYLKLQQQMYEDQPAVFLYSALTKLATRKEIYPTFSIKRPGYFLQEAYSTATVELNH